MRTPASIGTLGALLAGVACLATLPHEWIGDIDRAGFPEPSGVCFHPRRGTLFVVGDEGDAGEMRTDGTWIQRRHVREADFEGVTCDPSTGLLYVAIEGAEAVLEIDPESLAPLREFPLPRAYRGHTLMQAGRQGIEGIAFAPDSAHPQGGVFLVANQSNRLDDPEDISGIFEIELPLRAATGQGTGAARDSTAAPQVVGARIVRYFKADAVDIAGLCYDSPANQVLAVSDRTDQLILYARDGRRVKSWSLPGEDQEGIALDGEGFLYIAQDSGGIVKLRWLRAAD